MPGGARAERAQRRPGRGQHAEHRDRLRVQAGVGDRRDDDRRRAAAAARRTARARPAAWAVTAEAAVGEERPAEGGDADRADEGEGGDGAGAEPDGTDPAKAGRAGGVGPPVHARPRGVQGRRAPAATVSHGCGARILATCGAKDGEETTTSAVGPSATTSPSARMHHPVGELGGQLHVMGGQDDGVALGGQPAQHRDQTGLRRVVQAAGRLVEEQQRRAGRSARRPGRGRAAGPRTGRGGGCRPATPGQQLGDQGPAGAGRGARVLVGGRALGGDRVRVQQVARLLRDEADLADELARGRCGAGRGRRRATVPEVGSTRPTRAARRVDFPAPLRPMRAMVSPGATVRSTWRSASMRPRRTPSARGARRAGRPCGASSLAAQRRRSCCGGVRGRSAAR